MNHRKQVTSWLLSLNQEDLCVVLTDYNKDECDKLRAMYTKCKNQGTGFFLPMDDDFGPNIQDLSFINEQLSKHIKPNSNNDPLKNLQFKTRSSLESALGLYFFPKVVDDAEQKILNIVRLCDTTSYLDTYTIESNAISNKELLDLLTTLTQGGFLSVFCHLVWESSVKEFRCETPSWFISKGFFTIGEYIAALFEKLIWTRYCKDHHIDPKSDSQLQQQQQQSNVNGMIGCGSIGMVNSEKVSTSTTSTTSTTLSSSLSSTLPPGLISSLTQSGGGGGGGGGGSGSASSGGGRSRSSSLSSSMASSMKKDRRPLCIVLDSRKKRLKDFWENLPSVEREKYAMGKMGNVLTAVLQSLKDSSDIEVDYFEQLDVLLNMLKSTLNPLLGNQTSTNTTPSPTISNKNNNNNNSTLHSSMDPNNNNLTKSSITPSSSRKKQQQKDPSKSSLLLMNPNTSAGNLSLLVAQGNTSSLEDIASIKSIMEEALMHDPVRFVEFLSFSPIERAGSIIDMIMRQIGSHLQNYCIERVAMDLISSEERPKNKKSGGSASNTPIKSKKKKKVGSVSLSSSKDSVGSGGSMNTTSGGSGGGSGATTGGETKSQRKKKKKKEKKSSSKIISSTVEDNNNNEEDDPSRIQTRPRRHSLPMEVETVKGIGIPILSTTEDEDGTYHASEGDLEDYPTNIIDQMSRNSSTSSTSVRRIIKPPPLQHNQHLYQQQHQQQQKQPSTNSSGNNQKGQLKNNLTSKRAMSVIRRDNRKAIQNEDSEDEDEDQDYEGDQADMMANMMGGYAEQDDQVIGQVDEDEEDEEEEEEDEEEEDEEEDEDEEDGEHDSSFDLSDTINYGSPSKTTSSSKPPLANNLSLKDGNVKSLSRSFEGLSTPSSQSPSSSNFVNTNSNNNKSSQPLAKSTSTSDVREKQPQQQHSPKKLSVNTTTFKTPLATTSATKSNSSKPTKSFISGNPSFFPTKSNPTVSSIKPPPSPTSTSSKKQLFSQIVIGSMNQNNNSSTPTSTINTTSSSTNSTTTSNQTPKLGVKTHYGPPSTTLTTSSTTPSSSSSSTSTPTSTTTTTTQNNSTTSSSSDNSQYFNTKGGGWADIVKSTSTTVPTSTEKISTTTTIDDQSIIEESNNQNDNDKNLNGQEEEEQVDKYKDWRHNQLFNQIQAYKQNNMVPLQVYLQPWDDPPLPYPHPLFSIKLHQEILDFVSDVGDRTYPHVQSCHHVIGLIKGVVKRLWPNAELDIYGSFMTGLWLPSSDIDIVVDYNKNMSIGPKNAQFLLEVLEKQIRHDLNHFILTMLCIPSAKIPVIKLVTKENIAVDISFRESPTSPHTGIAARDLVADNVKKVIGLYPLAIVLKWFLRERGLNNTYSGGLSSYCLVLMLISFLKNNEHCPKHSDLNSLSNHHQNNNNNNGGPTLYAKPCKCDYTDQVSGLNIGCALMRFLEYYGVNFNYQKTGISIDENKYTFPLEDLNNNNNNNTNIITTNNNNNNNNSITNQNRDFSTYHLYVSDPFAAGRNVAAGSFNFGRVKTAFQYAFVTLSNSSMKDTFEKEAILSKIMMPDKK